MARGRRGYFLIQHHFPFQQPQTLDYRHNLRICVLEFVHILPDVLHEIKAEIANFRI
jgi:hypothetical protein